MTVTWKSLLKVSASILAGVFVLERGPAALHGHPSADALNEAASGAGRLNIVTVAGTGVFIGDGHLATDAALNLPEGVAVDTAGNLYIADTNNGRIRKVDATSGVITTLAGTDLAGFSGDGGPAVEARLNSPSDLALDPAGNLYFTDAGNHRIRRIDQATGIITTVAGNGVAGYSGDGSAATLASFNNPRGIALAIEPSGLCIYTADLRNHVVRKIEGTGVVTTAAGTGVAGISLDGGLAVQTALTSPFGVAVDLQGNIYIGEGGTGANLSARIRRVEAATGVIHTLAGTAGVSGYSGDGGPASAALVNSPRDVAVSSAGEVYFVDNGNNRIRVIDLNSEVITSIAGIGTTGFSGDGGPAHGAQLFGPFFLDLDAEGNVYIGDRGNNRIRKVDRASGMIATVAGGGRLAPGDGGAATAANIGNPSGIALDTSGNLYIAETLSHRIRTVDGATGHISTIAGNGAPGFSGDNGPATDASLATPQGIAVDAFGNLYIADFGNRRIRKVDGSTRIITTVAGNGTAGSSGDNGPAILASMTSRGIALDLSGNLWIADTSGRVRFVNLSASPVSVGTQVVPPGTIVTVVTHIGMPVGVAVDAAGNLYLSESHRVRFINLSNVPVSVHGQSIAPSTIATLAGTLEPGYSGDSGAAIDATLFGPQGLAVDPDGNVYIADTNNDRIRKIDTAGIITTTTGTGTPGFSGDGSDSFEAALQNPRFVSVDASGNIYVSEFGGNRVRRLNLAPKQLSVFRTLNTFVARLELHNGRDASDLSAVTLTAVDSLGRTASGAFHGTNLGPDPLDTTNRQKRVYSFPLEPALLSGNKLRIETEFADGRQLSADALPQTPPWGPMTASLGLKNIHDEGVAFDVRADVLRNAETVASGLARCISGLNKDPVSATDVNVEFDALSSSFAPFGSGDVLALRVYSRIGTESSGAQCPGAGTAAGLRLYYDGIAHASRLQVTLQLNTSRTLYLHSFESRHFLSDSGPTADTPLLMNSPAVSFLKGNPWKAVGLWSITMP